MRRLGDILELKDADRALGVARHRGPGVRQPQDGAGRRVLRACRREGRRPQACGRGGGEGRGRDRRRALGGDPRRRLRPGRRRPRRAGARRRALLSAPARDDRRGDRHQRKDLGRRLRAPDLAGARARGRVDRDDRRRVAPADRLRIADDAGPDRAARASRPARREWRHESRDRSLLAWSRPEAARRRAARRRRVHQPDARPHGLSCDGRGLSQRQA